MGSGVRNLDICTAYVLLLAGYGHIASVVNYRAPSVAANDTNIKRMQYQYKNLLGGKYNAMQ